MSKKKSDITLKIFAVIIALTLWIVVMRNENPEGTWEIRNIDVDFNNMEALEKSGLIIMDPKEAFVSVEVKGRTSERKELLTENIKAVVDLSGYSEGERKVPIKVTIGESKMKVTNWEPKEILFNFDKIIPKDKAVTIRTEGKLAPGYVLGDVSVKPETILLRGPRTWVNKVAEIIADINLTDRKEDINVTIPIKLIDDKGENIIGGVTNEPSIIDVFIPVYKTTTIPIEVQTVNELPENYEITDIDIKPDMITLKGKQDVVNLKSIQTKAIDINSFMEDIELLTELDLPDGVTLLNANEKIRVSLKIEEAFTKTFEYTLEEIDVRNLDPKFRIDLESFSDTVKLTLKGDKETIDGLSKEDIEVYMDLNMRIEGEQEIYLGYNVPSNISVSELTPQPIKFNLIVND